jgi:Family of unknown function (DUF5681)
MERKTPAGREPGNYEVGYCKPPRHTRFRAGRSGNPKGRGKHSKSGRTLLIEALNELVLVTEAGVKRRITKREAFCKSFVARALNGDARFAAMRMKIIEQLNLPTDSNMDGRSELYWWTRLRGWMMGLARPRDLLLAGGMTAPRSHNDGVMERERSDTRLAVSNGLWRTALQKIGRTPVSTQRGPR